MTRWAETGFSVDIKELPVSFECYRSHTDWNNDASIQTVAIRSRFWDNTGFEINYRRDGLHLGLPADNGNLDLASQRFKQKVMDRRYGRGLAAVLEVWW